MKVVVLFLGLIISVSVSGQSTVTEQISDDVSMELDAKAQKILEEKEICETPPPPPPPPTNTSSQYCNGYRIQVFYSKDRNRAESMFEDAKSLFPELYPSFEFIAPDYRVKMGYFENSEDAKSYLNQIKIHFSSSMLVQERFRRNLLTVK